MNEKNNAKSNDLDQNEHHRRLLDGERLLTAAEAAELCQISTSTMNQWIKDRRLKVIRLGVAVKDNKKRKRGGPKLSIRIEPKELKRFWESCSQVGLSNLKPDRRIQS
jgi:excisionase family DNA binding protein